MNLVRTDILEGDVKYHRLSFAAYMADEDAEIEAEKVGFNLIAHVHNARTGADAMIFSCADEVVVAFRGTQKNFADIMTDLKFRRVSFVIPGTNKFVAMHRGFRNQWLAIRNEVRNIVALACNNHRQLTLTGHSLGGSVAIPASLDLKEVDNLVTFGAPRVGDHEIIERMKLCKARHRRYVFGSDIVPIVPLLVMGYRHDVPPIYLTRSGDAIADCPLWRELLGRCRSLLTLNWASGWTWCPVPTRLYTDHRIIEYGNALVRTIRKWTK